MGKDVLLCLGLVVTVLHEEHGEEGKHHEYRAEGEEHVSHTQQVVKQTGKNGGYDLRRHGGGVVIARVFAHVSAPRQLHRHGEGVDVDGCPADASQDKYRVHHEFRGVCGNKVSDKEGGGKDQHACQDWLFPSHTGGDDANGNIGNDSGGLGNDEGQIEIKAQNIGGVNRILTGNGVVTDVPKGNGGKDQQKGGKLTPRELSSALLGTRVRFLLQRTGFLLHLLCPPRLLYGKEEDKKSEEHHCHHGKDVSRIGHIGLFGGCEDHAQHKHQNASHRSRQVDDGVGFGAKGLDGHIGHERHGRGAKDRHGKKYHKKGGNKADEGQGIFQGQTKSKLRICVTERVAVADQLRQLVVVNQGKANEGNDGNQGANQNKWRSLAVLGICPIGKGSENGEQKDGENVVDGHDGAGCCLRQSKVIGEDQGNDGVVCLPKGGDQKERHTHQKGAFVIQLHKSTPFKVYAITVSIIS